MVIFNSHINLAFNPFLIDLIIQKINNEELNALIATNNAINFFETMFLFMEDIYMKERTTNIKSVGKRILNLLVGIQNNDLTFIKEEVIIVANDLTPS